MSRRNSGQSQDVYEPTNLLYSWEYVREYVRDHQLLGGGAQEEGELRGGAERER